MNDTSYDEIEDCDVTEHLDLQKGKFVVWSIPYNVTLGGDLPNNMPVIDIGYYYGCNDSYEDCGAVEDYTFSQRYGLVSWCIFNKVDGHYELTNSATFNTLVSGQITKNFLCFPSIDLKICALLLCASFAYTLSRCSGDRR